LRLDGQFREEVAFFQSAFRAGIDDTAERFVPKPKGARTAGTFQSASANEPKSVATAVRADVAESAAYKWALKNGEIGLQGPDRANVKGADFITAVEGPGGIEIIVNDLKAKATERRLLARIVDPQGS
jgi:hypothetical protein